MADVKFKKGLTNALPSTKTEGQVYFSLDDGQAAGLSEYTGNLWFDYDSTHRVKINKHADMADKDGVGNNIADTYISQIKQNESTGTAFKFQGYDANDSKNANEISLPLAGDVAGLISNTTQTIKGNKTFSGNTTLYQILSQVKTDTSSSKIIPLPNVPYSLIDETHDTETYLKALIKWICANYTVTNTIFFGQATPNSQGTIIIHIYNTANVDENGYPQYARGTFFNLNGNDASFGFYAYVWRYSPKGYASESDKATSDGIGQNIADTYIAKLLTTHTTANQGTQFSFVGQDGNGSNNANEITITGATASKAGLITTGAQTLTGVKTFDGNGGITITGASKFVYSGIESATSAGARPVWFSYLNRNGTPVYNASFTYDPNTNQLNVGTLNATNIIEGSTNISSKYLVDLKQEASTGTSYQIRGYDGAGTGKTIISIPAASATVAGLITTGAQTLTGVKTFNASGGITIQGAAKFLYSGIESLATAANLPIWFGKSEATGTPGYNTKLTYNPSTDQLNVGTISATNILEGGTNISNRYLVDVLQEESTGTTYKIRGYDYAGTGKTIVSVPLASASVAGLISNTTQTITGDKTFSGQVNLTNGSSVTSGITTQLRGTMAANDYWRIAGGATASDSGYMEIATADNANEPIYIRQYSGAFVTLKRTLTLLDASGNTHIPGILYDKTETELLANNYISTLSNADANSGTYVGISGSNTNATIISTIQLPNASSTAAGVITNEAQTIAGAKTFTTGLKVSIGTDRPGQLLMMSSTYNSIFRNDGSNTYLLLTNSGAETWNTLRPFYVNNVSGIITMEQGLKVTAATASSSATTGALIVTGGTGVGGNIVNNGSLYVGQSTAANALIYLNAKLAFSGTDSWLRLNNSGAFTSGIYCGSSLVRTDGQLQVGSSGSYFYANNSGNGYFSNTLGIAGTNTTFKLYVNGTTRIMGVTSHAANVNPTTTNTYSLGISGTRWSALYLGTADSYGSETVPVYWNKGVPAPITSYSGNAATATKLQTARKINGTAFDGTADITTAQWGNSRTITHAGDFTGSFSTNGSANVTDTAYINYLYARRSNSNTTYAYHRILTIGEITSSYYDASALLYITQDFIGGAFGIARVTLRTNNVSSAGAPQLEIVWLIRKGFNVNALQGGLVDNSGAATADIYYYNTGTYNSVTIRVLQGYRGYVASNRWTLINSTAAGAGASGTNTTNTEVYTGLSRVSYTSTITQGTEAGEVNKANWLNNLTYGTAAPNNSDGKPDGAIYIQLIS